jgi:hypothetical protein
VDEDCRLRIGLTFARIDRHPRLLNRRNASIEANSVLHRLHIESVTGTYALHGGFNELAAVICQRA